MPAAATTTVTSARNQNCCRRVGRRRSATAVVAAAAPAAHTRNDAWMWRPSPAVTAALSSRLAQVATVTANPAGTARSACQFHCVMLLPVLDEPGLHHVLCGPAGGRLPPRRRHPH